MILAFFRLLRFKWLYSEWYHNAFQVLCCTVFFWSVWCLCVDVGGCLGSCVGLVPVLGLLFSLFAVLKGIWGFVAQFHSQNDLICFKERTDKAKLIKMWRNIVGDKSGFSVYPIIRDGDSVDFVSYSDELNRRLVDGLQMTYETERFRSTKFWREINSCLPNALAILALKLRNNGYQGFTNEKKVAILSEFSPLLENLQEGRLTIRIAKSCYYASYLTNESYRDYFYNGRDMASRIYYKSVWTPCGAEASNFLLDFNAPKSYHVGVNTLGITLDGWICLWRQRNGMRSNELIAPTGSGSMDWADVGHEDDNSFNSVIKIAAERELKEESFDKDTRAKLDLLERRGTRLCSRIIGMYRWGSLGGLPGFMLVTLIPMTLEDIKLPRIKELHGKGECVKDSEKLLDVSPAKILCGVTECDSDKWRHKCADVVNEYRETYSAELSVPVEVCLTFFIDALRTNAQFGNWLYSFLKRKQDAIGVQP